MVLCLRAAWGGAKIGNEAASSMWRLAGPSNATEGKTPRGKPAPSHATWQRQPHRRCSDSYGGTLLTAQPPPPPTTLLAAPTIGFDPATAGRGRVGRRPIPQGRGAPFRRPRQPEHCCRWERHRRRPAVRRDAAGPTSVPKTSSGTRPTPIEVNYECAGQLRIRRQLQASNPAGGVRDVLIGAVDQ